MADGALDAWALGVVAFELLTRTQAFQMIVQGKDEVRLSQTGIPHAQGLVCSFSTFLCMHACMHTYHSHDIESVPLPGAEPSPEGACTGGECAVRQERAALGGGELGEL
jgi:hypothetical protein